MSGAEGNAQQYTSDQLCFIFKDKVFPIKPTAPIKLGRGVHSDVIIADAQVSTNHATIHDGFLIDTRSTNGTTVNGNMLPPGIKHPLQLGDSIMLGLTEIRIVPNPSIVSGTSTATSPTATTTTAPSAATKPSPASSPVAAQSTSTGGDSTLDTTNPSITRTSPPPATTASTTTTTTTTTSSIPSATAQQSSATNLLGNDGGVMSNMSPRMKMMMNKSNMGGGPGNKLRAQRFDRNALANAADPNSSVGGGLMDGETPAQTPVVAKSGFLPAANNTSSSSTSTTTAVAPSADATDSNNNNNTTTSTTPSSSTTTAAAATTTPAQPPVVSDVRSMLANLPQNNDLVGLGRRGNLHQHQSLQRRPAGTLNPRTATLDNPPQTPTPNNSSGTTTTSSSSSSTTTTNNNNNFSTPMPPSAVGIASPGPGAGIPSTDDVLAAPPEVQRTHVEYLRSEIFRLRRQMAANKSRAPAAIRPGGGGDNNDIFEEVIKVKKDLENLKFVMCYGDADDCDPLQSLYSKNNNTSSNNNSNNNNANININNINDTNNNTNNTEQFTTQINELTHQNTQLKTQLEVLNAKIEKLTAESAEVSVQNDRLQRQMRGHIKLQADYDQLLLKYDETAAKLKELLEEDSFLLQEKESMDKMRVEMEELKMANQNLMGQIMAMTTTMAMETSQQLQNVMQNVQYSVNMKKIELEDSRNVENKDVENNNNTQEQQQQQQSLSSEEYLKLQKELNELQQQNAKLNAEKLKYTESLYTTLTTLNKLENDGDDNNNNNNNKTQITNKLTNLIQQKDDVGLLNFAQNTNGDLATLLDELILQRATQIAKKENIASNKKTDDITISNNNNNKPTTTITQDIMDFDKIVANIATLPPVTIASIALPVALFTAIFVLLFK